MQLAYGNQWEDKLKVHHKEKDRTIIEASSVDNIAYPFILSIIPGDIIVAKSPGLFIDDGFEINYKLNNLRLSGIFTVLRTA